MKNSCDFGHQTIGETRLLPYGAGGKGNMILCYFHYRQEMRVRFDNIMQNIEEDMPTWDSLKINAENCKCLSSAKEVVD